MVVPGMHGLQGGAGSPSWKRFNKMVRRKRGTMSMLSMMVSAVSQGAWLLACCS